MHTVFKCAQILLNIVINISASLGSQNRNSAVGIKIMFNESEMDNLCNKEE